VLYGVQATAGTTSGCVVSNWVNPATDATYTVGALMAGTPAAASLIKTICALRVGLILRTELPERTAVKEATSFSLFANFPAQAPNSALTYTRTLSAAEQFYRYRTIEATIPVRNNNF
jgi:type IV pilus assembly protein PilW